MGGSSSAPVVNKDTEIIGQHYGWSNGYADWCSNGEYGNYYAIDGAFASTYPMIEQFLGDVTSCTDGEQCDDGDACTQNDTCNSGTCAGEPIVCDTTSQTCQDGICAENNVCLDLQNKKCDAPCEWNQDVCVLA